MVVAQRWRPLHHTAECWTLRLWDTLPTVWSFRLMDTSPNGHFAYETFRLLDSSPIRHFDYYLDRLPTDCSFYQQDYQNQINQVCNMGNSS